MCRWSRSSVVNDVPEGGVLLALPALLENGLLTHSREIFSMPEGFYPLEIRRSEDTDGLGSFSFSSSEPSRGGAGGGPGKGRARSEAISESLIGAVGFRGRARARRTRTIPAAHPKSPSAPSESSFVILAPFQSRPPAPLPEGSLVSSFPLASDLSDTAHPLTASSLSSSAEGIPDTCSSAY
jgi:hypothetical protein